MDLLAKKDIVSSSVSPDQEDLIREKLLSHMFTIDEKGGTLRLVQEFKTILCGKTHCAMDILKNIEGWESVVDLDYSISIINRYSDEKKSFIQNMTNVDDKNYITMHFYIKASATSAYVVIIIGKKNQLLMKYIDQQKTNQSNIATIFEKTNKLEESHDETVKFVNRELITTSETLNTKLSISLDKAIKTLTQNIDNSKKDQENYVEKMTNLSEEKMTALMQKIVNRVEENENNSKENQKTTDAKIDTSVSDLNKKMADFAKTTNDTFNQSIESINANYKSKTTEFQNVTETKISELLAQLNDHYKNTTTKLTNLENFTHTRDSEFIVEFDKLKDNTNNTIQTHTNKITEDLNNATSKHETIVNTFVDSMTKKLSEQTEYIKSNSASLTTNLENTNSSLLNKIEQTQNMLANMITEVKNTLTTSLTNMKNDYDKKISDLDNQINDMMFHFNLDKDIVKLS